MMKRCVACKKEKDESEFKVRKNGGVNRTCIPCIDTTKVHYEAHKEQRRKYQLDRYHDPENKQKLLDYQNNRHRQNPHLVGEYFAERKSVDSLFKLRVEACGRLNGHTRQKKNRDAFVEEMGCSSAELCAHIESLFQPRMTWENKGRYGWHLDHIFPLSVAAKAGIEVLKKALNYRNVRPLWKADNNSKSVALPPEWPTVEAFMAASENWK